MTNFTRQQLFEALQKLPPSIREVVLSVDSADAFHKIMEQQNLTVEQIDIVANEVAPVTVGLVQPEELPLHLKRQLPGFPQEKLDKLVADINTVLLKEIRDKIVALAHAKKDQADATPSQVAPEATSSSPIPTVARTEIANMKLVEATHASPDIVKVAEPIASSTTSQSIVSERVYKGGTDPYREPIK
jgi:hypothetical protein